MSEMSKFWFCLIFFFFFFLTNVTSSENSGDGDWSVYPHWVFGNRYCYDFVDTDPYQFARIHADYDSVTGEFRFFPRFDIKACVSVASYTRKKILLHIYDAPKRQDLLELTRLLGEEYSAVWLHYDLHAKWEGAIFGAPFETVVVSLARETLSGQQYTKTGLERLLRFLQSVAGNVQKAVQLNSDMVRKSKHLDWTRLIKAVNFTIIYKTQKKGTDKEEILAILQSPIAFTIWDTDVLKSYGRESQFKDVNPQFEMFGPPQ